VLIKFLQPVLGNTGKILNLNKTYNMSHDNHNHESPKRVYFGIPIAFAMTFWLIVFLCLKACDGGHRDECCGEECSKECIEKCEKEGDEKKEGVSEEKKEGSETEAKEAAPAEEKKEGATEEKKEEGHH